MDVIRSARPRWSPLFDVGAFIVLAGALTWLVMRGTQSLGYNWQWYRVPRYLFTSGDEGFAAGPLLQGLAITFKITAASMVLSFLFGLVTALLRLSSSFMARGLARGYIELIRNTPLLIQIFLIYFVLSPVLGFGGFFAAVLALSLFEGAYAAEIFRAGIESVHKGQWEAAHSLGLGTRDTYLYVILPQAVRQVLPPLTGQAVSLIKDSALVSTIAIYDLTWHGQVIISETFLTFEIWFTVAAVYLVITLFLSLLVSHMESRLRIDQ